VKSLKAELPREAVKYLVVGAVGYVIDTSLFNYFSLFSDFGAGNYNPVVNKTLSAIIAITFTYVANSRWTFRKRRKRPEGLKRIILYSAVNAFGLALAILPLAISRYILGFNSLLADNISANIIGAGLALVFRFLANRAWVFPA
jgi:putative flippase GtrA